MIITNLDPNIFLIRNFIDEDQSRLLTDLAKNATKDEWANYNYTKRDKLNEWDDRILMLDKCADFDEYKMSIVTDLFYKMQEEVSKILNKNIYEYTGFSSIYRSQTGQSMKTHHDGGGDVKTKYGVVVYLNEDYVGGEIFYPHKGLEFKPEACSLVLHPAHEAYRHGVKEVTSGTRYSMTSFLKLK